MVKTSSDVQERLLLSKRDAAFLLSISLRTVDNLISQKQLKALRVGRRVLIHRDVLHRFAQRDHQITTPTESTNQGGSNVTSY